MKGRKVTESDKCKARLMFLSRASVMPDKLHGRMQGNYKKKESPLDAFFETKRQVPK